MTRPRIYMTRDGYPVERPDTTGMLAPVRCTWCRKVYDLCAAKVIHRYQDCTLFTTPCCGRQADDRIWKSMPDFTKLDGRGEAFA